jgi:hypothetical protein
MACLVPKSLEGEYAETRLGAAVIAVTRLL